MPAYSSANNAQTTLAAAITTTGQLTGTVASAALFPASGDYVIQIDSELLLITAGQGTTGWTWSRGVEGSSAATHLNGATVTLIWTTATLLSWGGGDGAGGAPGYWPTLSPAGLTGATALSRWVGTTNSGAPVAGTFGVGDFVTDRSGAVWFCTVAGTPGTWAGLRVAPAGRLYWTTTGGSGHPLVLGSSSFLLNGMTTSSGGLVVPIPGVYSVKISVALNVTSGGPGYLYPILKHNGALAFPGSQTYLAQATGLMQASGVDDVQCAAGDTLVLDWTSSGQGGNFVGGTTGGNFLSAVLVA